MLSHAAAQEHDVIMQMPQPGSSVVQRRGCLDILRNNLPAAVLLAPRGQHCLAAYETVLIQTSHDASALIVPLPSLSLFLCILYFAQTCVVKFQSSVAPASTNVALASPA